MALVVVKIFMLLIILHAYDLVAPILFIFLISNKYAILIIILYINVCSHNFVAFLVWNEENLRNIQIQNTQIFLI